jgi:hypothetical protein
LRLCALASLLLALERRRIAIPRLRTTPIQTDYIRDLRPAEWGSEVRLHGSNPKPPHVRFGSEADMEARPINVCFAPESGHWLSALGCPLYAKSGLMHRSKWHRFDQLIELQPGRLRQLDVRDNLLGNHGIKFLWADGHRFDTLRRKFGSHRGQCQRVLNLNVQLFDD